MAGLLDYLDDPTTAGLLSMGAGLLSASGPSRTPVSFGQAIGQGLLGGMEGFQQAKHNNLMAEMQKQSMELKGMELRKAKQTEVDQQAAQQWLKTRSDPVASFGQANGSLSPTNANVQAFENYRPDMRQTIQDMALSGNPVLMAHAERMKGLMPKFGTQPYAATGPDGKPVLLQYADDGSHKPVSGYAPDITPTNDQKDYLFALKNGYQGSLLDWITTQKRAGAPNVSTRITNQMGGSIAGQIGPMLKDSHSAALGAIQTADAGNNVLRALDSGKVITGPFANQRVDLLRLGSLIGVSGADDNERLANTRKAIQGLANMTLQGRKQMSGQGAITDRESAIAERAMSGDISLTDAELRELVGASQRASKWQYDSHQSQLQNLYNNKELSGMTGFYQVPNFPTYTSASQLPTQNKDFSVFAGGKKYAFKNEKDLANFKLEMGIR